MVFQLIFGVRIQKVVGLAGALMILPVVLFSGGAAMVFGTVYMMGAGLRVTEGGLRSSVYRSNWEQAFVGIPARSRPTAKVIVDGVGARLASGLAALMLYIWLVEVVDGDLAAHDTTWISFAIVISTAIWIVATAILRRNLKTCEIEPHAFMPSPLADSCPTTATLGGPFRASSQGTEH